VLHQRELVSDLVGTVPVTAVLCFVEADWPLLGGSFTTRGLEVCWPKVLVKKLAATDGTIDVPAVAAAIAAHFPPA
jgi:hypothetical protein